MLRIQNSIRFDRWSLRTGVLIVLVLVPALADQEGEPIKVTPSASYVHENDGHGGRPWPALCDGDEPSSSNDHAIRRFTFWNHKGTREWVQYEFDVPAKVSSVEVYWFDDDPRGGCRVPAGWKLLYRGGGSWRPVEQADNYTVRRDQFNVVTFRPVVTTALRIEVTHQPNWSGGILEWKVNGRSPRLDPTATAAGNDGRGPDYLRTRLALAMRAAAIGGPPSAAEKAITELDEVVSGILEIHREIERHAADAVKRRKALNERLATIQKQHDVKAILRELHKVDRDACLRLMIQLDWLQHDIGEDRADGFQALAVKVIDQLRQAGAELAQQRQRLIDSGAQPLDGRWMQLYLDACRQRRVARLTPHLEKFDRVVFTKHHDIGGQHYAYTEDVSDSPYSDNNPFPHSGELCLLEMQGVDGHVRTLLSEPDGLIRDPAVSYDGDRILFARRKSMIDDDYHLYELTLADGLVRQLTFGTGVADYEPAYLPSGDIVFNSSRCQQIVDCWWADVSNLYTCDGEGRFLRRLSFDQVHTNYPTVMPDGRVIYTRWDYNDRGQLFPQPLFQMNPDGTGQREYYGNNSWFPTSILHARGIPGTDKVVCVLSGHHTYQKGKLAIIDPSRGRQEASGVQLIAPVRHTEAVRIDMYGHQGEQFQYPYPLSETEFLVTYSTKGSKQGRDRAEEPFGIYFMAVDGQRELLAADPNISCNQPVPLAPRPRPPVRPSTVDYRQKTGTFLVQDIYQGPGLAGVPRGTVKRLRVVALDFRAAGIGSNSNRGPAGGALVSTPISINGAWDVKQVLGSARVHDDGSAAFTVPARTPVYFQALDENNYVVQTMRSWSTLQPGETFSCVGCHADQNRTPHVHSGVAAALKAGPQPLQPLYDGPLGFSFPRLIQPILDRHCVQCHNRRAVASGESTISLEGNGEFDQRSQKSWSDAYQALADSKFASWVSPQSEPTMQPPYATGAARSMLIEMLTDGHEGVELTRAELDLIACWIDLGVPFSGDYTEGMAAEHVPTYQRYLAKRQREANEEAKRIEMLIENQ